MISPRMKACVRCGEPVEDGAGFCEACGTPVAGVAATAPAAALVADDVLGSGPISAPTHMTPVTAPGPSGPRECLSCGGSVGPDGYCEACGTKAQSERDHFRENPAAWVAGVCDRGLVHSRNEDAMALLGSEAPGERAVLVVLDGVSNTDDSHIASLAGARAARQVLSTPLPQGMGTPESRLAAVTKAFADAVAAANDAVVAATPAGSTNPPSATFVCAIVENGSLSYANVGDSRSYWLPDGRDGVQLSVDDSAAQQMIAAGMAREDAENSPQAHAITRWLGRDAPDLAPRAGQLQLTEPGWLLVCSDGLWNYASEPAALVAQIAAAGTSDPTVLALALTAFANSCGGRDNITATLARIDMAASTSSDVEPVETPLPAPEGETHG